MTLKKSSIKLSHPTGIIDGVVSCLPGSKSLSARALLIQALADEGAVVLRGLSESGDTMHLTTALQAIQLGQQEIYVGEGGTTLRFLLAYCAVRGYQVQLKGSEVLNNRPLQPLIEALRALGARLSCTEREGCAPVRIEGFRQISSSINLSGTVSSQFASALLLVAPVLPMGLQLNIIKPIVSESYLEMTLGLMNYFGIAYQIKNQEDKRQISIEPQSYQKGEYTITADWSSASYWYAVAALSRQAKIWLPRLSYSDFQGDKVIADVMRDFGVFSTERSGGMMIEKVSEQRPSYFFADCESSPDLAQTLGFLCAGIRVAFRLEGLSTLAGKETNRLAAMSHELKKMGANVICTTDSLQTTGYQDSDKIWKFESYGDHRMALAAAPLALLRPIEITSPQVVGKSYPKFWRDMQGLGFRLELYPSGEEF